MWMSVYLHAYAYTPCVTPGILKGQKRVLDPLKVEIQMVVGHHIYMLLYDLTLCAWNTY